MSEVDGKKKLGRPRKNVKKAEDDTGLDISKDLIAIVSWLDFFYRKQDEYISSEAWQTWFIAGNGTGKSLILAWSCMAYLYGMHPKQHLVGLPPIKARYLIPDFDKLEEFVFPKFFEPQVVQPENIEIPALLPKGLIKEDYSKDKPDIKLVNKSQIQFKTSKQGWRAMSGGEYDMLIVDEEPDERVMDECVRGLRNAKGGGRIIAGMTPPIEPGQGPTWTKEKVVEASLTDSDVTVVQACMKDNPAITPEFIRRFSKGKTEEQVKVQVYGEYPSWGDLVYPFFQNTFWHEEDHSGHLLPNDAEMPEAWEVEWLMAFDWHPSKPCAAIWGYVDSDKNVTIFDELDMEVARNKDVDELSHIFKAIEDEHSGRKFKRWQDPSAKSPHKTVKRNKTAWDLFREHGIITSAGRNRDPMTGVSIVNDYFKGNAKSHPRVFIYERCKFLRQYLTNHYWKRGEDGVGLPDPKWSDYPICLRYILEGLGHKSKDKRMRNKKWPYQSFVKKDPPKRIIDISNWR